MLQTNGSNNFSTPLIASDTRPTSTPTHWDNSGRAFLWKTNNRTLLAVFKIGSNALFFQATLHDDHEGRKRFINVDIFLPSVQEFKAMGLETKGLLGIYDNDTSNDCIDRNGSFHSCETNSPGFHSCGFISVKLIFIIAKYI